MLNLKQVQPEAKPLPNDRSLTLEDQAKRAPALVKRHVTSENSSTSQKRRYDFSGNVKQHVSSGVSFQLKILRYPMCENLKEDAHFILRSFTYK